MKSNLLLKNENKLRTKLKLLKSVITIQ